MDACKCRGMVWTPAQRRSVNGGEKLIEIVDVGVGVEGS